MERNGKNKTRWTRPFWCNKMIESNHEIKYSYYTHTVIQSVIKWKHKTVKRLSNTIRIVSVYFTLPGEVKGLQGSVVECPTIYSPDISEIIVTILSFQLLLLINSFISIFIVSIYITRILHALPAEGEGLQWIASRESIIRYGLDISTKRDKKFIGQ